MEIDQLLQIAEENYFQPKNQSVTYNYQAVIYVNLQFFFTHLKLEIKNYMYIQN